MKKLLTALSLFFFAFSANAKEKLYILNSGAIGGSFNAQMTAYTEDLKAFYDVKYVQGKGCNKANTTIKKIVESGGQVFYIWNGLRTADYLNGKNDLCGKIPSEKNFVNSVLKYGIFFTTHDGINKDDIFKSGIKVGFNSNTNKEYLTALAKEHNVDWKLIRYEHSKAVRLGVVNKEVDFGMINSAASYHKQAKKLKLKALYTLNEKGENGIAPLAGVSKFEGANNGIADLFLMEGGDTAKLRKIVSGLLADQNSKIATWYNTAKGYTQTVDLEVKQAVAITNKAINNWVKKK